MAYKFSRGTQIIGDLSGSDDAQRDTGIDFEDNYIGLQTSGSTVFVVSGSKVGIGTTTPSHKLDINGDIRVRGNDIRDNSGNPAISFDGSANTTIVNTLTAQSNISSSLNISGSGFYFTDSIKISGAPAGQNTVIDNQGNFFGNTIDVGTVSGSNIVITDSGNPVYQLPIADGNADEVIATDGSGSLSYRPGS